MLTIFILYYLKFELNVIHLKYYKTKLFQGFDFVLLQMDDRHFKFQIEKKY